MNKLKFHEIKSNKNLFILKDKKMFITIYINNLFIIKIDINHINKIKTKLNNTFKMIDLNLTLHYLKMKIQHNGSNRIFILL